MSSARSHIESALSGARASNNLAAYEHLSKALDALDSPSPSSPSSETPSSGEEEEGPAHRSGSVYRKTKRRSRRGRRERDGEEHIDEEWSDRGRDVQYADDDDSFPYRSHRHSSRSSTSTSSSSGYSLDPFAATLGTVLGLGLLGDSVYIY
ncbi:hypothetical protein IAR50_006609 [Cryptococcus sp. DSM 104548]